MTDENTGEFQARLKTFVEGNIPLITKYSPALFVCLAACIYESRHNGQIPQDLYDKCVETIKRVWPEI